jgi:hypothetical protein
VSERPDIVIRCDHGVKDPDREPDEICRYEWKSDQNAWVSRYQKSGTLTFLDGDDPATLEQLQAPRQKHRIKCQRCSREVPLRDGTLFWAFHLIVESGHHEVTVDGLQKILLRMPRALKG